jgi:hypothetical protein
MEEKKESVVEETAKEPKVDNKVEKLKVKKKPSIKKLNEKDGIIKVDLSKPKTEVAQEQSKDETPVKENSEETVETKTETSVLEEVAPAQEDEKTVETNGIEELITPQEPIEQPQLPENVEKLVDFIKETGGDINDYVKLNQNYDDLDNLTLLKEYYKQTKPHLDGEEISFLMDDKFSYDEERDEEIDIKRKKLALKEQVANAKSHLDGLKSKYYEDIKAGSKLTEEQQKAIDFFNRHKQEEVESKEGAKQRNSIFQEKTGTVFNDKFKGFEYNVGEKKFRYNVQDANKVKESQSDITNFIGKFLDEKNEMSDAEGYHKSLFTAMNPDAVAKHFYEQGQADALKQSVEKGKNINMDPRQQHGEIKAGGMKFKVMGDNSADFKFKIKNNK